MYMAGHYTSIFHLMRRMLSFSVISLITFIRHFDITLCLRSFRNINRTSEYITFHTRTEKDVY